MAKIHTGGFPQKTHSVHTEPRVVRRPMEETLETGRTLSIPCS